MNYSKPGFSAQHYLPEWVIVTQSYPTLCDPMRCSLPGSFFHGILQSGILEWVAISFSRLSPWVCSNSCPLNQWCHPTVSSSVPFYSCPQSFTASGSFQCVGFRIRWPEYWSFSFSISPSIEYSGLIFFRMDWFDLLAVQGTLKNLLQHHSSKKHQFFRAQPSSWSNSHIHTWLSGKIIALTRQTFVGKVMSQLFNMLSRFVIAFLPSRSHGWAQR